MPSEPLQRRRAQRLRGHADELGAAQTMTPEQLGHRYGVSRLTALRALRELRDEGLVDSGRGRRIRQRRQDNAPLVAQPERRARSWERCASVISEKVNTGVWRAGTPLPKIHFFTNVLHVSRTSVEKALGQLSEQGVVYRQGKSWYAGPRVRLPAGRAPLHRPVVLLLQSHEDQWMDLYTDPVMQRFVDAFTTEAESYGVQLYPALTRLCACRFG